MKALLSIILPGVDYLPGAHRPWVVDLGNPQRYPGRGKSLIQAARMYFRKGK